MSILSDKEIKELCAVPKTVGFNSETMAYDRFSLLSVDDHLNKFGGPVRMCKQEDLDLFKPMIAPFIESSIKKLNSKHSPSYGLGSYSYDVRIDRNFKVFKKPFYKTTKIKDDYQLPIIDTCSENPTQGLMEDHFNVDYIDLQPGGFALGNTIEAINMPRDVLAICMAKSSLARIGLQAMVTPLEPGWSGKSITIELHNQTPFPIRIWAGIGIMALVFLKGNPCEVSYADRGGKYQNQPAKPVETVN